MKSTRVTKVHERGEILPMGRKGHKKLSTLVSLQIGVCVVESNIFANVPPLSIFYRRLITKYVFFIYAYSHHFIL